MIMKNGKAWGFCYEDGHTPANAPERLCPAGLFCVGLPDTQGGMCWLAGYESDPTRYYTCALMFESWQAAAAAIERAKKTHPFKERTYRIMTVAEMETQNGMDERARTPASATTTKPL